MVGIMMAAGRWVFGGFHGPGLGCIHWVTSPVYGEGSVPVPDCAMPFAMTTSDVGFVPRVRLSASRQFQMWGSVGDVRALNRGNFRCHRPVKNWPVLADWLA
jgi:hypothetical protein